MGALRKVVVFRTLAQEQLENLADALEAAMKSVGPGWSTGIPGDKLWNTHSISGQAKWGKIRCPCQVESRKPGEIIFNQGARCSGGFQTY